MDLPCTFNASLEMLCGASVWCLGLTPYYLQETIIVNHVNRSAPYIVVENKPCTHFSGRHGVTSCANACHKHAVTSHIVHSLID